MIVTYFFRTLILAAGASFVGVSLAAREVGNVLGAAVWGVMCRLVGANW